MGMDEVRDVEVTALRERVRELEEELKRTKGSALLEVARWLREKARHWTERNRRLAESIAMEMEADALMGVTRRALTARVARVGLPAGGEQGGGGA